MLIRRDFERHRLINVARAETYSDMQMRSVILTSLQNVSKCAFAANLMCLIISTNPNYNLDHLLESKTRTSCQRALPANPCTQDVWTKARWEFHPTGLFSILWGVTKAFPFWREGLTGYPEGSDPTAERTDTAQKGPRGALSDSMNPSSLKEVSRIFYSLDSFRILRELILYAELIYLSILQICIFRVKISYFFIRLWFELKIVTNESLPQMIDCTFLFSLPSEHYHSPQSISVMKIINFVKSAKTSFSAPPWSKNARECFAPLCLYTTRPAKTDLKTSARQPDPNSLQSLNGMTGAHKTDFLRLRLSYYCVTFRSCCQDESFDVSCSCWWGVTLRGIGWSMSLGRRHAHSDMQTRSVIFTSSQNVPKCAFAKY